MRIWVVVLFLLGPKFAAAEAAKAEQIKLEFRDLGLAYFENLKDCNKKNPQAKDLTELVQNYNSTNTVSLFDQNYSALQILLAPDLYKRLSYQNLINLVRPLIQIQKSYSHLCGQEFHSFGSGFFDDALKALLEDVSSNQKWSFARRAYQTFYWTGASAFDLLKSWLPVSLSQNMPMLKESWIGAFTHALVSYPPLHASLTRVLATPTKQWKTSAEAIYQWIQPFRVSSYDLLNENLIFPGLQQLIRRRTTQHWQCMVDMATGAWPSFNSKNLPAELLQFSAIHCPDLPTNERLTLFYSDDRMSHWLLPLTFKLALIDHPEWLENPKWLSNIQQFSAKLKELHTGHNFNHVIVPLTIASLEENRPFAKDLILIAGALYQILDAESKFRLYHLPNQQVQNEALADLKIWHNTLTN